MCSSINGSQKNELVYMPIPQPEVGNLIKTERKARQISQKTLGEQVGVSHQTIATWERGVRAPTEINLIRLAIALDKPDDFFFNSIPKEEVHLSSFCENLRTWRKRCGKTQTQLSEETGISLVAIKAYEDSNSGLPVTEANLQKLSDSLGTTPKELLGISLTAETLQRDLRESHIEKIKEAIETLNLLGLEKAAERITEIATHRRYQK